MSPRTPGSRNPRRQGAETAFLEPPPGCPDVSAFNDFTIDGVWTKAIGILLGDPFGGAVLAPGGRPLSVINSSVVEPTRLSLDGVVDNACHPVFFPCINDNLWLGAKALIPFSAFGTCTTLTISGTWRQPTPLTFAPATDPLAPHFPYNPPHNWGAGSIADVKIQTNNSGAINVQKFRSLFAQKNPTFGQAALNYYTSVPLDISHEGAPADFVDENWTQVLDLSVRDPADTALQIIFDCVIASEPFNPIGGAYFYNCGMAGLVEVRNVLFTLTP
jgi:hypothetical protein